MKYALLVYPDIEGTYNVGDYIQSLAARQFLPRVDLYLNRDQLSQYKGEPVKLIMNSWFTHDPCNWIPSEDIDPLFVSFHVTSSRANLILSEKGINYLKKHSPIGCRDIYTRDLLQSKGIDAYFSGCLTLTLDSYKASEKERTSDIYIVDPLYTYPILKNIFRNYKRFLRGVQSGNLFRIEKIHKHLDLIISKDIQKDAIYTNQQLNGRGVSHDERFKIAENLLLKYARAKMVITSRIHCALPSLALETPTIYVNGFTHHADSTRLSGLLELFNQVSINSETGEYTSNFLQEGSKITLSTKVENKDIYLNLANELKSRCRSFIED